MKKTILTLTAVAALALTGCSTTPPTETVTQQTEVTPLACIEALAAADDIITWTSEVISQTGPVIAGIPDAVMAGMLMDADGIDAQTLLMTDFTAEVNRISGLVDSSPYVALRDECVDG